MQECKHRPDDEDREEEVHEPPVGVDDSVWIKPKRDPEVKAANERARCRCWDWVCAVEILDHFLQYDCQTKGYKDLVCMWSLIEMFDQSAFHDEPDQDHDWHHNDQRDGH